MMYQYNESHAMHYALNAGKIDNSSRAVISSSISKIILVSPGVTHSVTLHWSHLEWVTPGLMCKILKNPFLHTKHYGLVIPVHNY